MRGGHSSIKRGTSCMESTRLNVTDSSAGAVSIPSRVRTPFEQPNGATSGKRAPYDLRLGIGQD